MGKKKKADSSKLLKTLTFWDYVRRCETIRNSRCISHNPEVGGSSPPPATRKAPKSYDFGAFIYFSDKISAGQGVGQIADPHPDPQAETPRYGQTVPESTQLIVLAASRLAEVVTWA